MKDEEGRLTTDEREELLRLARAAIESALAGSGRPIKPSAPVARLGGAFVTITIAGELRGCIGSLDATQSLASAVAHCAVAASSEDPRFPPLTPDEVPLVRIEISVLGPLERVVDVGEIEVGRHGLLIEQGIRRGLLLPQVATEHGWDRETFLRYACMKATLPADAWRNGATIYRFEAEVFGEEERPRGSGVGERGPERRNPHDP